MLHIKFDGKAIRNPPVESTRHQGAITGKIVDADIFAPGKQIDARPELLLAAEAPPQIDMRIGAAIHICHQRDICNGILARTFGYQIDDAGWRHETII